MRLRVIAFYKAGPRDYKPGDIVDCREDEADLLLRDSPGSFEPETEQPEPGLDRRQRGGRTRGI